ncbi:MAG: hypothetical protein Q7R52_01755 [archaeon]|nr:hypothetical protein [archaeon]
MKEKKCPLCYEEIYSDVQNLVQITPFGVSLILEHSKVQQTADFNSQKPQGLFDIGKGCKICSMILDDKSKDFCSDRCRRKYEKINRIVKIVN